MALLRNRSYCRIATGPPGQRGRLRLWAPCLALFALVSPVLSQPVNAPEPRVKAAFIYNFTKLVDWPTNAFATSNAPLVVGVLNGDPVGKELDSILAGREANGHPLQFVRYKSLSEISNCHVLYISESVHRNLDTIFKHLEGKPVLTVGDTDGFATQGMIELFRTNDNIGFRINLQAATEAGLKLSSRLIRLDRRHWPSGPGSTNAPPQRPNVTE